MTPVIIGMVLLVLVGFFFSKVNIHKAQTSTINLAASASPSLVESSTTPSAEPTLTSTPTPTPRVPIPILTSFPTPASTNIQDFKYPNSSVKSQSNNSLELESGDDTDKITDWYQDKIRSLTMNVKSFVKTKTNDNVLNKLTGSNGKLEISVEIKKEAGFKITKIRVNISPT